MTEQTKKVNKTVKGSSTASKRKKTGHRRRKRIKNLLTGVLVIIAVVVVVVVVLERSMYHKYAVISSAKNEDVESSGYVQLDDCILKYAANGASLLNNKQETIWTQSYEMQDPIADVRDETAVVADKDGTLMYIFNKKSPVGAVETSLPVVKACVARNGLVAAILKDGEKTWINFYATDGSLIAENQTRVNEPGYPVDLAVSPDGQLIMITYLYVENGQTNSYVVYYNFGDAGQSEIDNLVAGFRYEGVVVPQVEYLNDQVSLAFRDDGFTVYRGSSVPKEAVNKKIEEDIVSTFYNEKYIGVVFKSKKEEQKFTMQVFDLSGNEKFQKHFNLEYKNIKISDDMIVMNNDSQVSIVKLNGIEKYNGNMDEGAIKEFFKIGSNQYVLASENGIKTIKLKR